MDDPLAPKIAEIASRLGLGDDTFRALNEQDANVILQHTQDEFLTQPPRANWWWEVFREPQSSIQFQDQRGYERLGQLISSHKEKHWFIASRMSGFLVYEGTIDAIQTIIGECHPIEYYVVSKSYEWLLCENHHNFLIAVGSSMVEQMDNLRAELNG